MKRPSLLQTTAARLAIRYALLYVGVLGIVLAALLWSNHRQMDEQLEAALHAELTTLVNEYRNGGTEHLAQIIRSNLNNALDEGRLYLLAGPQGSKISGNLLDWPPESDVELNGEVQSVLFEDNVLPGGLFDDDAWLPVIATELPDGSRLLLAREVEQAEELQELSEYLVEGMGAAIVLLLIMGITLGHAILRRMDTISRTADEIMAGDLSQRIPVTDRNDEFDALASRLNSMLDRIQLLIKGIREVTDNIAHDLRSPLTRLRNRLEVTLLEDRSGPEYRKALQQGIQDAESLINTFNTLLGIAQAEAGNHRAQWGVVDLGLLVHDLADLYRPAAEAKQQQLELRTRGDNSKVRGTRDLLAQAISNLLENAIKYTPVEGSICLQVTASRKYIEIIVADTGPGIPESEREHVLERFVRLESSRHTQGNGLGLSLVQAVAGLYAAELSLDDANPGLVVTLRFFR